MINERLMIDAIKFKKALEGFQARDHLRNFAYWLNFWIHAMAYIPIMILILVLGLIVAISDEVFNNDI